MEDLGGMGEVRVRPGGPAGATTFQWQDMLRGDLMLMSLANHRYLLAQPRAKSLCAADAPGATADCFNGTCFGGEVGPANSRGLALIRTARPGFSLTIAGRSAWFLEQ